MYSVPHLMTADQLYGLPSNDCRYQLVKGILERLPFTCAQHGEIRAILGGNLALFVRTHKLGVAYGADAGFQIGFDPDTVISTDIGFITLERRRMIRDHTTFIPFAPDLAIEVLSPDDTYSKTIAKIQDWLTAGTRAGVLVDPRKELVSIYRPGTPVVTLDESKVLEVPDIVPGWSMPVSDIFQLD